MDHKGIVYETNEIDQRDSIGIRAKEVELQTGENFYRCLFRSIELFKREKAKAFGVSAKDLIKQGQRDS